MTIIFPTERLMLALNAAQMRRDIAEAEHRRMVGYRIIVNEGRITPPAPQVNVQRNAAQVAPPPAQ